MNLMKIVGDLALGCDFGALNVEDGKKHFFIEGFHAFFPFAKFVLSLEISHCA